MDFVAVVGLLAVLEYIVIAMLTGRARGQYGVKAPATTGHPIFERWYRVQQNTVEQMIAFLPGLFLFASYVSPRWASILGLVFIVGRIVYARGYIADPEKRATGFAISMLATLILVLGGLIGAL
jgi:uncharacterized MAPEG superfamily protein